jgi:hypothetical protein
MKYQERKYWAIKKIRKVLHEYLLKTDPEYQVKSKEDQERIVLIAISDMMRTFEKSQNS